MGSGTRGQFTFLDLISIASFLIAIENFDMNVTQEDVQEIEGQFDRKFDKSLEEIHEHLAIQDAKLNHIIHILEGKENDR